MRYVTLEEVIYIYTEIMQRTGGEPGIANESILEEVLNKPLVTFDGEQLYPDIFTKVAVLMYALIHNRPFVDGNKRAALICAAFILKVNGYHIFATQEAMVELLKGIESGQNRVDNLIVWLKKNAVPV